MSPEKLIAAIVLVSLTFGAGLQVDRENLIAILRRVGLLGRALLANFIIVPIIGVLLARLFALPPEIATGMLLMAIAPGVPFVLTNVRKRGGSLSLAVELAMFMPILSVFTVPITAQFVLPHGEAANVPLGHFVVTLLLFQAVPLLLGIMVAYRLPKLAPRLEQIVRITFYVSVIALVVVLARQLGESVATVYGSRGMVAMLCLVLLSMLTGWALGGPARETRRVLGMATALRNIGLAAVLATNGFAGSQVPAAVITYLLIQMIVVTIIGLYFARTSEKAPA